MEHIARVVGKDPVEVRLLNLDSDKKIILQPMIEELSRTADYDARKRAVEVFNNVRFYIPAFLHLYRQDQAIL